MRPAYGGCKSWIELEEDDKPLTRARPVLADAEFARGIGAISRSAGFAGMMKAPPLILASASPRRAELLRLLGVAFRDRPRRGALRSKDGAFKRGRNGADQRLSQGPRCFQKTSRRSSLLGVDTVVALGRSIFGKPATWLEAEQMLLALAGKDPPWCDGRLPDSLAGAPPEDFFRKLK
jgi:hypothetical protein